MKWSTREDRFRDDSSQRLADLHYSLAVFMLVPGMHGTVECLDAARRVNNCSQIETPAHVLTDDEEHLANLVRAAWSPRLAEFFRQQSCRSAMSHETYKSRHQRASAGLDCGTTAKSAT